MLNIKNLRQVHAKLISQKKWVKNGYYEPSQIKKLSLY